MEQQSEVEDDDDPDEGLEDQDELALGDEIGLARLVDELGDLAHRLVHGQGLELPVDDEAEGQAEEADHQAPREEQPSAHAAEAGRAEIGNLEGRLTATRVGGGGRTARARLGDGGGGWAGDEKQGAQRGEDDPDSRADAQSVHGGGLLGR